MGRNHASFCKDDFFSEELASHIVEKVSRKNSLLILIRMIFSKELAYHIGEEDFMGRIRVPYWRG
jgi:hypothetical protein